MDNNTTTNVVTVEEDTNKLGKVWNGIVKSGVKIEQLKLKSAPAVLKVTSVFAPEAAPALLPLAGFLESPVGKKLTDFSSNNYEVMGDVLTGNFDEAKDKFVDNLQLFDGKTCTKLISETKKLSNELDGNLEIGGR